MIQNKYKQIIETSITDSNDVRRFVGWNEVRKGKYFALSTGSYQNYQMQTIKIQGVIPANFEKVASYFFDNLEGQKKSRQMCDTLKLIEKQDADTQVLLFRTKGPNPREILGVQHKKLVTPYEYLILRGHLDEHPAAPADPSAQRAEGKIYSVFVTKESENSTRVQVFMLMDPKAVIPPQIFEFMLDEQLGGFESDVQNILSI